MAGRRRKAWTLMEVMVTLTIVAVLLAFAVPGLRRSLEQARADTAAANLRAVWAAQRLYWLENHSYATNLAALGALIDPSLTAGGPPYIYSIASAGGTTLSVTATRTGGGEWSGQLSINEAGRVTGSIAAPGQPPITPGFS